MALDGRRDLWRLQINMIPVMPAQERERATYRKCGLQMFFRCYPRLGRIRADWRLGRERAQ
jgi:hypothetical protein